MRAVLLSMLVLLAPTLARAADLLVSVRTASGRPVADAVVTLPDVHGPSHLSGPYRMAQHDLQFDPFVLVVPVGAEVAFPNLDKVRHHVYSFSPAHPFELKLYGRDESRKVRFDKAGVIALGCNIHDSMVAFILVTDAAAAAKTDANGLAVLHDVPAGDLTVRVWHPYLRAAGNTLTARGQGRMAVTAEMRAPPEHRGAY
ncbi:methylamine utilization protein [Caulobacter sp. KR2-114]|uniref:methylamine utilization protein n=1 Tax=Caulobacter sp. KR2-114 TaxID=3400912 RepID=UPI003C0BFBBE